MIATLSLAMLLLSRQPASAQPGASGDAIERRAVVPLIVLPESAFLEALSAQHFRVDRATVQRAVRVTAQANAPGTAGALATLSDGDGTKPFSGTVFLVVRDRLPAATIEAKGSEEKTGEGSARPQDRGVGA
ncbi:hypothetical protein [Edaphobacter aggregans]|uniref:hypothetical protein n=1 Tax=Edaphobacter aggregans TaxID=570835 RepID=UPI0005537128